MRIAVFYGGDSPERAVSLMSGREVAKALRRKKHEVRLIDTAKKTFLKITVERLKSFETKIFFFNFFGLF